MADEPIVEQPSEVNKGQSVLEIEGLILRYVTDIEKLKSEIKDQNDMFKAAFEGDSTYSQQKEAQDKAKREIAATKQVLANTPAASQAEAKAKELKEELKSLQDSISVLLLQRQKLTDNPHIIRDDGEAFEVKTKVSLVKQSSKAR